MRDLIIASHITVIHGLFKFFGNVDHVVTMTSHITIYYTSNGLRRILMDLHNLSLFSIIELIMNCFLGLFSLVLVVHNGRSKP
jgi:hypothetical protein